MIFQERKKDKIIVKSIIICLFLSACHWVQFFRSGCMIPPLVHAVMSTFFIIFTSILGRKCWNIYIFVWALSILYFGRFNNYTSFIMVLIAIGINRKTKSLYIVCYAVAVLVCLIIYRDTYTHAIIHAGGCMFFYNIAGYVYSRLDVKESRPLELTEDEKIIIEKRLQGYEFKEIEEFSENTCFIKLKNARTRNGIDQNWELIQRYKQEIETIK